MPQDTDLHPTAETKVEAAPRPGWRLVPARWRGPDRKWRLPPFGLSAKLLLLTLLFVMLAEVLIFIPSLANYRVNWLNDRLRAAYIASLATEVSAGGVVPVRLRDEILRSTQVKTVAVKRSDMRRMVLDDGMPETVQAHFDLRSFGREDESGVLARRFTLIWDAVAVLASRGPRNIRVIGDPDLPSGAFTEIILNEAALKHAMLRHSLNILGLSIIISMITAALVYLALRGLLVQPMRRLSSNMLHFSAKPEDQSRVITPSSRRDEIGTAERELAHMQAQLAQLLTQKSRLAALGLAVSKINHDLRNMLASAQLISDRLGTLPDPTVQRLSPKLVASLDRAIAFCNDTLKFGRAEESTPRREPFPLHPLLVEIGDSLGLPRENGVGWQIEASDALRIDADREQLYRVLSNLVRNAVQAMESQPGTTGGRITARAWRRDLSVLMEISDTGPGVPARARAHLFEAFQGSARRGGTGLGLVIAQELIAAHGGTITLVEGGSGATFRIEIPDRPRS